jgi:hypothetical protein
MKVAQSLVGQFQRFLRAGFVSLAQLMNELVAVIRTQPPIWVLLRYLQLLFLTPAHRKKQKWLHEQSQFRKHMKDNLLVSADWFTENIPIWSSIFDLSPPESMKANLKALEIGSFEGLSASFLFWKFPYSKLTCVDTWAGTTEHLPGQSVEKVFTSVESIFLKNTAAFRNNIRIFKGKSIAYFAECSSDEMFDFVYVDGSHHSDDVMIDALKSFNHLRKGGVLVFDDYLWNELEPQNDNPGMAINSFLRLKKPHIRLLHVGYQLILRKI